MLSILLTWYSWLMILMLQSTKGTKVREFLLTQGRKYAFHSFIFSRRFPFKEIPAPKPLNSKLPKPCGEKITWTINRCCCPLQTFFPTLPPESFVLLQSKRLIFIFVPNTKPAFHLPPPSVTWRDVAVWTEFPAVSSPWIFCRFFLLSTDIIFCLVSRVRPEKFLCSFPPALPDVLLNLLPLPSFTPFQPDKTSFLVTFQGKPKHACRCKRRRVCFGVSQCMKFSVCDVLYNRACIWKFSLRTVKQMLIGH